jgi:hypothetical protein
VDKETNEMTGGTASSWRRLIEELSRARAGKFIVTIDGRAPVSVSRVTQPFHLQDREEREVRGNE